MAARELGGSVMSSSTPAAGSAARRVVAASMALVGALFVYFLIEEDVRNLSQVSWSDLDAGIVARYVAAMLIGGAVSGWLFAGLFGRGGAVGWVLVAIGGVLATLLAGLLGSAIGRLPDLLADGWNMSDLLAVGAGLLVPVLAIAGQTHVAFLWIALIVLAHLLARRARG